MHEQQRFANNIMKHRAVCDELQVNNAYRSREHPLFLTCPIFAGQSLTWKHLGLQTFKAVSKSSRGRVGRFAVVVTRAIQRLDVSDRDSSPRNGSERLVKQRCHTQPVEQLRCAVSTSPNGAFQRTESKYALATLEVSMGSVATHGLKAMIATKNTW